MQNFTVARCKWRSVTLLAILGGFGAFLATGTFTDAVMFIPLAGWSLLTCCTLWNAARSLASGEVGLSWDGQRLVVYRLPGKIAVEIESARWVFSDRTNIVIRGIEALPKFDSGHVRCNGREMTIDGFLGYTPEGLSETAKKLGPSRSWLWRYMAI